jgi:hypothetical protein
MFPQMTNWTQWCYSAPTMLLYDHKHVIESSAGVQQETRWGPFTFVAASMGS